jgi:hypothetical protein
MSISPILTNSQNERRPHIVWFYSYEISRTDKTIEIKWIVGPLRMIRKMGWEMVKIYEDSYFFLDRVYPIDHASVSQVLGSHMLDYMCDPPCPHRISFYGDKSFLKLWWWFCNYVHILQVMELCPFNDWIFRAH